MHPPSLPLHHTCSQHMFLCHLRLTDPWSWPCNMYLGVDNPNSRQHVLTCKPLGMTAVTLLNNINNRPLQPNIHIYTVYMGIICCLWLFGFGLCSLMVRWYLLWWLEQKQALQLLQMCSLWLQTVLQQQPLVFVDQCTSRQPTTHVLISRYIRTYQPIHMVNVWCRNGPLNSDSSQIDFFYIKVMCSESAFAHNRRTTMCFNVFKDPWQDTFALSEMKYRPSYCVHVWDVCRWHVH